VSDSELEYYCSMMDIDGDGVVSIDDIQTFMSRHKYIGQQEV